MDLVENTDVASPFYTTEELSRLYKVCPATVRRWLRDGVITGFKFRRLWRVPALTEEQFETWGLDWADAPKYEGEESL